MLLSSKLALRIVYFLVMKLNEQQKVYCYILQSNLISLLGIIHIMKRK